MDDSIRIWSLSSSQCVKTLLLHKSPINCLLVIDDCIISGSNDTTIKLYCEDKEYTLKGHTSGITCLAEMDNGKIISGSNDACIKVWTNLHCELTFKGHSMPIKHITPLTNDRVASMSLHYDLKIWNMCTGELLNSLKNNISHLYYYFSYFPYKKHHSMLLGITDNKLLLTDGDNIFATLKGHTNGVTCNNVLIDDRIITGSHDTHLRIWNSDIVLTGHKYSVTNVLVLPNGTIVSSDRHGTIIIWR